MSVFIMIDVFGDMIDKLPSPETVIAHCSCHAAFRNFSFIALLLSRVMAHRSCMLTVLPISQGRYLIDFYSVVLSSSPTSEK